MAGCAEPHLGVLGDPVRMLLKLHVRMLQLHVAWLRHLDLHSQTLPRSQPAREKVSDHKQHTSPTQPLSTTCACD